MKWRVIFFILALILLILANSACKKDSIPNGTPDCVRQEIERLLKEDCPSVSIVTEYTFLDKKVYVFDPKNCGNDLAQNIYDDSCNIICFLGGIAGFTTCEGSDFYLNATGKKIIWKRS